MRCLLSAHVILLAVLLSGPGSAQTPVFIEQNNLLDDSDITDPPFSSGGPIGVVDLNGDRRDDILRIHNSRELRIEFQAASGALFGHLNLGAQAAPWGWSICAADVDRNGINDFVVGINDFTGGPSGTGHTLFLGQSDEMAFIAGGLSSPVELVQDTLFADLDNDGMADLFACDDIDDLHKYRNTGGGIFVFDDTLLPTQLTNAVSSDNEGNYAVIGTDYDNDGDVDYYLSKCRARDGNNTSLGRINRLFQNDGSGNYTDVAAAAGLADGAQTWCADFADIDNDGDMDCFVLNHQDTVYPSVGSKLYENDGTGVFTDITQAAGLDGMIPFLGFQACFRDFNNDGWIDLLVTSMGVTPEDPTYGYYQNNGDGSFTRISGLLKHADTITNVISVHSCAIGDLNHDGFLDLYAGRGRSINNPTNTPDLLLFNQGNTNGYFSVTLVGAQSNINGIGARIEAHGPWGVQVREVRGGEGYGIMNSLNAHFGIGAADAIDRLKVRWPSGITDEIQPVSGNRFATLHEGTGRLAFSFTDWITGFHPDGGPDATVDADPDQDRIPNLIEQVLGGDPAKKEVIVPLTASRRTTEDGDHMEVRVDRVPAQDVEVWIEFSNDGVTWTPAAPEEILENTPTRIVVQREVAAVSGPVLLARLRAEAR